MPPAMASSKTRIQNYIRQNKISELFEEMMGRLIKDLPASPIHYLVTLLEEKEKKIKHIARDFGAPTKEKKLEISNNAMLWATAPAGPVKKSTSPRGLATYTSKESPTDGRKYEKPWQTHLKKTSGKTKPGTKLRNTVPSPDRTSAKLTKPDWNQKTKILGDKKSDVVDGDDGVDLGLVYAKPKIVGDPNVRIKDDVEEMQAELQAFGKTPEKAESDSSKLNAYKKSSKISAKEAKKRRLEELKRLAEDNERKAETNKTKQLISSNDEVDDDALEVLENADDLINEGVKNPPKSGFVVSNSNTKAKEEIELVLNMSKFFDELGGMEGVNQAQMVGKKSKNNSILEDDDDFESASQVTGPRRPVWEAPESEVESIASQKRSARRSGVGVDSFDVRPDSGKEKTKKASKSKNSETRPRTAPSRSNSKADMTTPNNDVVDTYKVTDPKVAKSPRSPQGSVVGAGKTSRRMSQNSNHSDVASPAKKHSEHGKKKKSEVGEGEHDTRVRKSSNI